MEKKFLQVGCRKIPNTDQYVCEDGKNYTASQLKKN